MIPVMLDQALVRVALCGNGILTVRRLKWLRDCGADPLVFAPHADAELAELAGAALIKRLPEHTDLMGLAAIWIADFATETANPLAEEARAIGVLVNFEDVLDYCDFHTPAVIHRGRLTLAVGTGGASPAIASIIRQRLETAFPPAWESLVDGVASSRLDLKAKGATFPELVADATARLVQSGL